MTLNKAILLQDQATNAIVGVFSDAEKHSHTHEQMLDALNSRLARIRSEKLPRWLQSAIGSMISVMFRAQYLGPNPKVVWKHCVAGVLYANWNDLPEHGKELGRNGKLPSGHYWAASLKPFSVSAESSIDNNGN